MVFTNFERNLGSICTVFLFLMACTARADIDKVHRYFDADPVEKNRIH